MKGILGKSLFMAAAITLIVTSLAGCGQSTGTQDTQNSQNTQNAQQSGSDGSAASAEAVKIGVILPLSGGAAPLGEMSKNAMELATEEINENGGIKALNGAKLELVFADSQGKPQVGVTEAERLLAQEKVTLLTGAYQSGVTLPASEVAERYKKIWLASVPSDESITTRGFKYVFRLADTSPMRVKAQIAFLDELKKQFADVELKKAAIVYENTAWGQGVGKAWKELLPQAGFDIVVDEAYDKNASDLTPVVTKVKNANPDVVLMVSYVADATLLANGFKQQKVVPKAFIGTSGGYADPEFIKNAGNSALNFYDLAAWEVDANRPFSKEVDGKFFEKFGVHMNGEMVKEYVGMYTIADALERAGSTDSEKLREAFAATNITEGPSQMYAKTIHFDESGTLPDPSLVMVQFKKINGVIERVTVWPKEDAREGAELVFPYKAE